MTREESITWQLELARAEANATGRHVPVVVSQPGACVTHTVLVLSDEMKSALCVGRGFERFGRRASWWSRVTAWLRSILKNCGLRG